MSEPVIRPAGERDLPGILALLETARLPVADVTERCGAFLVAEIGGALAGAIALEAHPPSGLLRSLVVDGRFRGRGLAASLCGRIIERARGLRLRALYLLTLDADRYFARHGFTTIERSEAPEEIRRTEEFSRLCPASAVLMKREIGSR